MCPGWDGPVLSSSFYSLQQKKAFPLVCLHSEKLTVEMKHFFLSVVFLQTVHFAP